MNTILRINKNWYYCSVMLSMAIVTTQSVAQTTTGSVMGVVIEIETKQSIPGVHIAVEGLKRGAVTNEEGRFTIEELKPGSYLLHVTFLGFSKQKLLANVIGGQITTLETILLEEEVYSLDEITVIPGRFSIMGDVPLSKQMLPEKDIKNMSWAEDVTRAVARIPGISSSDYSSKFTIRGGEADEVLITLDGMELYEPFHQRDFSGGLFSIVDIEAIQGIELMTGGFSADYGNRLSGVFNMKTRNIQRKSFTSVGISTMNSRFYHEGTFANKKGSYLFSARRGMLDLVFKTIGRTENLPNFYDAMGKIEYSISPKHKLSFHALQAGDRATVRDISEPDFDIHDTKYGNSYGWLTLKSNFGERLYARTLAYAGLVTHTRNGSFSKNDNSDKGTFSVLDKRNYSLFGIKQDLDWQTSDKIYFKAGFEIKRVESFYNYQSEIHDLRVDSNEQLYYYDNTKDIQIKPSGVQLALYLSGRYKVLNKLIAETGVRYDQTTYTGDKVWSPRVSLAYAFAKNTFLRGAWGYYYQTQFINAIDVNNGNVNFNPAKLAKHYVLGFEHLFKNGVNFRIESYLKKYSNLSPTWQNMRDHLEVWPESRNDNARVIYNGGDSKGIEVFLKYDQGGKYSWWLGYALAKAEDNIKDIEFDGLLTKRLGKAPRLNNQQHSIFADLNYRPNDKWHFNLSETFYVGWPRTTYTYHYTVLPDGRDHFYIEHKEFNSTTYPAYHRMDLRINRHFKTRTGAVTAFLHFVNLYNRKNLKKFDLDTTDDNGNLSIDAQGNYVPFHDDKYWFRFLPVFGVSWEF